MDIAKGKCKWIFTAKLEHYILSLKGREESQKPIEKRSKFQQTRNNKDMNQVHFDTASTLSFLLVEK